MNEVFTFKGNNNLNLFNQYIISSPGGFIQMLSNYSFPDVKYLLGYWYFIDYYKEMQLHYCLHFKLDFSFLHSNKTYS